MGDATQDASARDAAEAAARRSYGRLVAFLAARARDVAAAEDALSAAFEAALRDWPQHGVPDNPEAWLYTAARRSMIDAARRRATHDAAAPDLLLVADLSTEDLAERAIPDERLALMFACAHPAIDAGVHAPLMLQTILGFDAASIASAFLVAPSAMGQRLVRAKAKIKQARIPFRIPDADELPERVDAVLRAIYATYSAGWSDPAGTDSCLRNLAGEGIWLGRLTVALLPDDAEARGLLALMLHAEARRAARRDAAGHYVALADQDPRWWDDALIDEAEALLQRASRLSGPPGRYQLEAAVQSVHAARRHSGRTDWAAIAALYDALMSLSGSPVVAINRAVALAESQGAAAGLAALQQVDDDPRLADYQPYWAARAGLLARAGDHAAADAAYARAIGLESDPAVRRFLQAQRARLGPR
ncbi:MAG: RNA polymerase subunit sigma-70 [Proteobacteria bacterium]|nr:RNA polymerase subunit sigma-70 [Pseudomonadota bacterium]